MNNLSNFFPETVYFCDCLQMVKKCKKTCSLQDLCNEINNNDSNDETIYCVKCGNEKKDVVFSCCNHMAMGSFLIQTITNEATVFETDNRHFCLLCIKKYLRKKYHIFKSHKVNN